MQVELTGIDKNKKYFDLAKNMSMKSDHRQYKLGCVIVKKNTIISTGYNQLKTHPKSPDKWKMIHAEFSAIYNIPQDLLKGSTAYVYREFKTGKTALAKPCKDCENLLRTNGIKTVYFTTTLGYSYLTL